jgi:hypothetical protein
VKIDPFALVSAIEKYLLLRGVASGAVVNKLNNFCCHVSILCLKG